MSVLLSLLGSFDFFFRGEGRIKSKLTAVDILLVGKYEEHDVAHFAVLDDAAQLGFGFFQARAVARVYYEDEGVGSW